MKDQINILLSIYDKLKLRLNFMMLSLHGLKMKENHWNGWIGVEEI